jgi:Lrp/AsnC family leucine-responsive transcriptional regulator
LVRTKSLDLTDRRIIDEMRIDPYITQASISRKLGLSQPSVAARVKHLRDSGTLVSRVGLDLHGLRLAVGDVTLSVRAPHEMISQFKNCPCFVEGCTTSGEQNTLLIFAAEDVSSLQGIIDERVRDYPHVSNVHFKILNGLDSLGYCPVLCPEKKELSPCGRSCSQCSQYRANDCVGCPATFDYRGVFWSSTNGNRKPVLAQLA